MSILGPSCPKEPICPLERAFNEFGGSRQTAKVHFAWTTQLKQIMAHPLMHLHHHKTSEMYCNLYVCLSIMIYPSIYLPNYLPTYLSVKLSVFIHWCMRSLKMTRPVGCSEIDTMQDRLQYSDTEVIHQVTRLSQEFHRVSPLVKRSWRRSVTSEWHPPVTKSKEVRLKRWDESDMCKIVQICWRIGHCGSADNKTCASHYHTCDHLEVDGENAWNSMKSHWKAFGKFLDNSCFHFSFIHFRVSRNLHGSFVIAWPHAAQNHQIL